MDHLMINNHGLMIINPHLLTIRVFLCVCVCVENIPTITRLVLHSWIYIFLTSELINKCGLMIFHEVVNYERLYL